MNLKEALKWCLYGDMNISEQRPFVLNVKNITGIKNFMNRFNNSLDPIAKIYIEIVSFSYPTRYLDFEVRRYDGNYFIWRKAGARATYYKYDSSVSSSDSLDLPSDVVNKEYLDTLSDFQLKLLDVRTFFKVLNIENAFSFFNFLLSVRDHYNKFQTTACLFTSKGDREIFNAVATGNVLKILENQMLVLNGGYLSFFSTFSVATNSMRNIDPPFGRDQLIAFIRLTTMGYLKQGDILTTPLLPYFKSSNDISATMNRIDKISPVVNGVKSPPSFITEFVGSIVSVDTVPTGDMVVKVINDIVIEADKIFTKLGY